MSAGTTKCQVGPQHVGAQDAAGGERRLDVGLGQARGAHAHGPHGAGVVLRLHRAQVRDHGLGASGSSIRPVLVAQALREQPAGWSRLRGIEEGHAYRADSRSMSARARRSGPSISSICCRRSEVHVEVLRQRVYHLVRRRPGPAQLDADHRQQLLQPLAARSQREPDPRGSPASATAATRARRYGRPWSSLVTRKPREPLQDDGVAAVGQLLVLDDASGAAHRVDGRTAFVFGLEPWAQSHHPDDAIALQRVGNHRAVARLENQQRPRGMRKQRRLLAAERSGSRPAAPPGRSLPRRPGRRRAAGGNRSCGNRRPGQNDPAPRHCASGARRRR